VKFRPAYEVNDKDQVPTGGGGIAVSILGPGPVTAHVIFVDLNPVNSAALRSTGGAEPRACVSSRVQGHWSSLVKGSDPTGVSRPAVAFALAVVGRLRPISPHMADSTWSTAARALLV
jgi:hypothetical protein